MTKAEAFISNSPKWKSDGSRVAIRHDDTPYEIRVYQSRQNGKLYEMFCDSYYGYSRLFCDSYPVGPNYGHIEHIYDEVLAELV